MSDILTLSQIKSPAPPPGKDDAIREAGQILVDAGAVGPEYIDAMFEREKSVSTYMGNFLAIPHGTNEAKDTIKTLRAVRGPLREPDRLGRQRGPVRHRHRRRNEGGHLEILGKVAIIFSDMDEVDKLIAAGSAQEIYDLLNAVNEDD